MILKKSAVTLAVLSSLVLSGCDEELDNELKGNDDQKVYLSVSKSKTITEPENGKLSGSIEVTLSSTYEKDISFAYDFTPMSAKSGVDYEASGGQAVIKEGARSVTLPFEILGDVLDEDDETFSVTISDPKNAKVRDNFETSVITIRDEDEDSKISFLTDFATVTEGAGKYTVKVQLTTASEKDVKIPFTVGGLATEGQDYEKITQSPITVPAGANLVEIAVDFLPDTIPEGGESVVINLESPTNASLGELSTITLLIPGEVGLNDTGIDTWFDGESFASTSANSEYPGQDAEYGRDSTNQPSFDGPVAFSFTKLDDSGNSLPSNAQQFSCVQDNRTGLVWEVKNSQQELPTSSGKTLKEEIDTSVKEGSYKYHSAHANWRASNYSYYWLNADSATNGGSEGSSGENFTSTSYPISSVCAFPERDASNYMASMKSCNTSLYQEAMNTLAVCGFKNWRLPRTSEIASLHNYSVSTPSADSEVYFPNSQSGDYLTSDPSADGTGAVWCTSSDTGHSKLCNKQTPNLVRMVRGGAQ